MLIALLKMTEISVILWPRSNVNNQNYIVIVHSLNCGSKRHSLQAVELSQRTQAAVQIVLSNLPAPSNGGPIYRFLGMAAMRTRWMPGAVDGG